MRVEEALDILRYVWGNETVLDSNTAKRIEAVALPEETALHTVARIAGVDVSNVKPFNSAAIRWLCSVRETELNGSRTK